MSVEIITEPGRFGQLRSDWNSLLDSSGEAGNVFLRHEWFQAWFEAFGAARKMFVLLCYDQGQLQGVAPLMLFGDNYKGLRYTRLGFIEDANAPSMNIVCRTEHESRAIGELLGFLLHHVPALWDVAVLNKVPVASLPTLQECLKKNKVRHIVRPSMDSPYIDTNGEYDAFLQTTTPKFRKQLRNKVNRLEQQGDVEIRVYDTVGEGQQYLEEAMSVSRRSWKHAGKTSMTGTPERERFFRALSRTAQDNGWLRIWLLRLGGQAIATEYHLEYAGITHAMRGDFDQGFEHLSPGSVLESAIIKHCFANSLKEYDFCGLPYGYKMRWSGKLHERRNVLFYPRRGYPAILYAAHKHGPVIRRVASSCCRPFRSREIVAQ